VEGSVQASTLPMYGVLALADNFAAGIRASERNAFARVAIAELFSLAHRQAADPAGDCPMALRAISALGLVRSQQE
jgi:hypothetical protein